MGSGVLRVTRSVGLRIVVVSEEVPRATGPLVTLAADRVTEVPETVAQRPGHLRQALWPQDEKRHDQDEQKMGWLQDVGNHSYCRVAVRARGLPVVTREGTAVCSATPGGLGMPAHENRQAPAARGGVRVVAHRQGCELEPVGPMHSRISDAERI
jgi:hypothetical protein